MVLVSFNSAMMLNDNGYVLFPEVIKMDSEFARKVNEIGENSKFVLYNLYLTDLDDVTVEFINKSFRGSFVFIKSEVLNRWFLMTPFSKDSWEHEHVIVQDEKMQEMLLQQNQGNEDGTTEIITCFNPKDIN